MGVQIFRQELPTITWGQQQQPPWESLNGFGRLVSQRAWAACVCHVIPLSLVMRWFGIGTLAVAIATVSWRCCDAISPNWDDIAFRPVVPSHQGSVAPACLPLLRVCLLYRVEGFLLPLLCCCFDLACRNFLQKVQQPAGSVASEVHYIINLLHEYHYYHCDMTIHSTPLRSRWDDQPFFAIILWGVAGDAGDISPTNQFGCSFWILLDQMSGCSLSHTIQISINTHPNKQPFQYLAEPPQQQTIHQHFP